MGQLVGASARMAVLALTLLTLAAVGGRQLADQRLLSPPQFDRETAQAWLQRGPYRWAVLNGAALGVGATTRLGYWLWYLVPVGSFATGTPLLGALIYGAYGLARSLPALLLYLDMRRGSGRLSRALLEHYPTWRRAERFGLIAAAGLLFIAT
ncbi:MAG TPA: hypothetical protein VFQ48_04765 [Pseudonocardiaceae bacterium]|nr:hypothetical protein [Pseudonocardiaceae bacterium]